MLYEKNKEGIAVGLWVWKAVRK